MLIGAILFMLKRDTRSRGIRNNNPGNIRKGETWLGLSQFQTDASFATFVSPEYGIRALARILSNYQSVYGLYTVRDIINRYAPPSENSTTDYVKFVSDYLGVLPTQVINVHNVMPKLIEAITIQENGSNPYTAQQINTGVSLA